MVSYRDIKPNGMVEIWDLGPQRPESPVPPVSPKMTGNIADQALARIEYEDLVKDYETALRSYSAARKEFDHYRQHIAGPIKCEMWPVSAKEAIERHPERWSATLPKGVKPGKAQAELDAKKAEEAAELQRLRDEDPHFGNPEA